jgi:hypothetical protein
MYMLGLAAVFWSIWNIRNNICFDKKEFKSPCEIIFLACVFIRYLAGLYSGVKQELIEKRVQTMIRVAMQFLEKNQPVPAPRMLLMDGEASDEDQDNGGDQVDHPGA